MKRWAIRTTRAAVVFGAAVVALALAAPAQAAYTSTVSGQTATMTGDSAGNALQIDISGGLMRHNRFSAGDPGFADDFDFDTSVAGRQPIVASDSATVNVSGGNVSDSL